MLWFYNNYNVAINIINNPFLFIYFLKRVRFLFVIIMYLLGRANIKLVEKKSVLTNNT